MVRVHACQLDIAWEDKQANFTKARDLVAGAGAAPEPGSLVVLPEMFATGFSMDAPKIAEEASGETAGFLSELASECQCTVVGGVVSAGQGRFFNEALVVSASGDELARYRKMHLFSPAGEDEHYSAGEAPVVFEHGGFRVAPLICYDLRFPEVFRACVRRGVDLFVVIANWPAVRVDHWATLLRARAIENQAYLVGVNRAGRDPSHEYPGRSMTIDPRGEVLAEAGPEECVLSAEINPALVEETRREFPALRDQQGWTG